MTNKILSTLTTFILVILPFLLAIAISKYSPYQEGNSFQLYVIISAVVTIAAASVILLIFKHLHQPFEKAPVGGALLFLLLCPLVAIYGLAAAPDLSLKMLEHPEREHLRYILLFIAALLFGAFFLFQLKNNSLKIKPATRGIIAVVIVLAFAEFIWEFTHHYLYPEALNEWVNNGKNAEEFGKNYDNRAVYNIGVYGRLIQFSLIIWLSIHLYKLRLIKIWSPILSIILSLIGIVSAIVIYITEMSIPKGFEALFLFFIPGIPFFLFYWLGVALLTKFQRAD